MGKILNLYAELPKERLLFGSIFFNNVFSRDLRIIKPIPKNCDFLPSRFKPILIDIDEKNECIFVLIKHSHSLKIAENDFKKACKKAGCSGANLQQFDLPDSRILQILNVSY